MILKTSYIVDGIGVIDENFQHKEGAIIINRTNNTQTAKGSSDYVYKLYVHITENEQRNWIMSKSVDNIKIEESEGINLKLLQPILMPTVFNSILSYAKENLTSASNYIINTYINAIKLLDNNEINAFKHHLIDKDTDYIRTTRTYNIKNITSGSIIGQSIKEISISFELHKYKYIINHIATIEPTEDPVRVISFFEKIFMTTMLALNLPINQFPYEFTDYRRHYLINISLRGHTHDSIIEVDENKNYLTKLMEYNNIFLTTLIKNMLGQK